MQTHAFDYEKWAAHFARNRENRPEPDWGAPCDIAPQVWIHLVRSIEQFQLGDGGGPASLIAFNAETFRGKSEFARQVVDAWFREEKEHSRLLSCAVQRLGGQKIKGHWSFTAFCACRRLLGVRFELQILLLTELVSTAYYRLLRRHLSDPPLQAMCGMILRDEAGHVAFHRDRLASEGIGPEDFIGALWEIQFWICGHGAASVLWSSHRKCLQALGATRAEYFAEVRYELARFVRSLAAEIETPEPIPAIPAVQPRLV